MIINQKELLIKSIIKNFSIETTPKIYSNHNEFIEMLPEKNDVYITYLPNENEKNIINTCKKINDEGLSAIPHLPARTIKNESDLEKFIGYLSEVSGCKKILRIGGGGKKIGNIDSRSIIVFCLEINTLVFKAWKFLTSIK